MSRSRVKSEKKEKTPCPILKNGRHETAKKKAEVLQAQQASLPPILLLNVAVPLQLGTLAQDHGGAEQEDGVEPDKGKRDGEVAVEEGVGKVADGADAAAELGGGDGVGARLVQDEGGRDVVVVATAGELGVR